VGGWDSVIRDSQMGKGRSGGGKPPKKGGCGKKAAAFLLFGLGSTFALGNAIWQSLT
jgi:hypothetical protein